LLAGTALLSVHEHIYPLLTGRKHLVFELFMEFGGLFLLAGLIWALFRRYIQRLPRLERKLEDCLVPLWFLGVVCSGFLLEGARVNFKNPSWSGWSFTGAWVGRLFSGWASQSLYPYIWWGHTLLSLGFIAVIPYTKTVPSVRCSCLPLPTSFPAGSKGNGTSAPGNDTRGRGGVAYGFWRNPALLSGRGLL